jgi:hypothetical protein
MEHDADVALNSKQSVSKRISALATITIIEVSRPCQHKAASTAHASETQRRRGKWRKLIGLVVSTMGGAYQALYPKN